MNDPKYWNNPQEFRPERFLENGRYLASRPTAFIPFGTGRRICLGEKMAINDVFLVVVRFLQSTNGYELTLRDGPGSADMESDDSMQNVFPPKKYEIILKAL
jgi:cytochrome P450